MTSRLTILQVVPTLDSGGAERTTLEMVRAIVARGGHALVASHGGRLAPDIEAAGGYIFDMPVHSKIPVTMWRNADRLAKLVRKERVDIIHARSRAPAWSALWAARRTGAAFVTTYHGAYEASTAIKRFYNSAMTRSDRVIANSRFTAASITSQYDLPDGRLAVIPRGADIKEFNPVRVSDDRIAQLVGKWGISAGNDAFRILFPARPSKWKGQATAIDAIAQIKGSMKPGGASGLGRNLTLVFVGGAQGADKETANLRALADERGVRDMVNFVGECADMPAAYEWADVVLAPSTRPEAFGRVIVEAGAMGKPVIASRHGGALETVVDGETGFLVAPGDASALADAISNVCDLDASERVVIGEKARARVSSLYSTETMCDATMRVYRDLVNERVLATAC